MDYFSSLKKISMSFPLKKTILFWFNIYYIYIFSNLNHGIVDNVENGANEILQK